MTDEVSVALLEYVRKVGLGLEPDFLREAIHVLSEAFMEVEVSQKAGAECGRYYAALEGADVGLHSGFPEETDTAALRARLDAGDVEPLTLLLCEGLLPRLTRLTVLALETREPLMELPELAARLGVKEPALRKRIERGALLAIKRGKRVYSHPLLAL
jgi:hypothetical protein